MYSLDEIRVFDSCPNCPDIIQISVFAELSGLMDLFFRRQLILTFIKTSCGNEICVKIESKIRQRTVSRFRRIAGDWSVTLRVYVSRPAGNTTRETDSERRCHWFVVVVSNATSTAELRRPRNSVRTTPRARRDRFEIRVLCEFVYYRRHNILPVVRTNGIV